MALNEYCSLCEERQKIIVSKDVGMRREHRAINRSGCKVRQYQIDGDVIRGSFIRCDFLVMNDDTRKAYLIELKGSDVEHAIDQLEATYQCLAYDLKKYQVKYRLVCSKARTHEIKSNKYKRFSKQHDFVCKENKIEEII